MIRLDVPMVPPPELSPNASRYMHWGTRTKAKNAWARAWHYAAKEALGNAPGVHFAGPVRMRVTYLLGKGAKAWDTDNLIAACKAGRDQLQAVGLIDDDKQVVSIDVAQERAVDGIGRTVVEITEETA